MSFHLHFSDFTPTTPWGELVISCMKLVMMTLKLGVGGGQCVLHTQFSRLEVLQPEMTAGYLWFEDLMHIITITQQTICGFMMLHTITCRCVLHTHLMMQHHFTAEYLWLEVLMHTQQHTCEIFYVCGCCRAHDYVCHIIKSQILCCEVTNRLL